ncbi:hypothetical protein F5B19DRAFT_229742 [Rostrohypoxylon terebratum]|nr:hypothetical protein F5B19DRAFT_229742 [Rostrohypoxylon terebratum]
MSVVAKQAAGRRCVMSVTTSSACPSTSHLTIDYLTVDHTFVCDRGSGESDPRNQSASTIAKGDGRLLVGLVDTPKGHFTGAKGDNMTIAAYPHVAHRLPCIDCATASRDAKWEVRGFEYSTILTTGDQISSGLHPPQLAVPSCPLIATKHLPCTTLDDDPTPRAVSCDPITLTIKANIVS